MKLGQQIVPNYYFHKDERRFPLRKPVAIQPVHFREMHVRLFFLLLLVILEVIEAYIARYNISKKNPYCRDILKKNHVRNNFIFDSLEFLLLGLGC